MENDIASPTLLLALRRLARTDAKSLVKSAVKELVAGKVLTLRAGGSPGFLRRAQRFTLTAGPAPLPPTGILLEVARMVSSAPSHIADGRLVHDLGAVAKHLSGQRGLRRHLLDAALRELADAGLVRQEHRTVLWLVPRTVYLRTPSGDAVLARAAPRRQADGDGLAFDGFDRSFDSSFDSSFDAGFSDGGGGDGGGGD